ncbi:conserved hypothetical protein [Enterococcus phage phiFL2A]|uniref:Uncharacterized protein gp11 n=1 Tax=Enterococcus phage phiFL2A TaxID=673835 RepID=D2IZD1_9CAUD|nr:hypothetical protein EP-phiFL2A_gp11 [Enterococcus phage phiFL2A]ACZ63908.1 conserved hypothetical protein [Enterococcus phage phiFL2A]
MDELYPTATILLEETGIISTHIHHLISYFSGPLTDKRILAKKNYINQ